jgi:D-xylose 1-dehydrogenase (NADP+, D-xylono-1,5-lactone-forming)
MSRSRWPCTPSGRSRPWRRASTSCARSRSPPAPPTPSAASTPPRRPAATLRQPADVLAQFDVALDLTRRDELELVGTGGRLTVPDPWLCRATHLELSRDGQVVHVPVDPVGALAPPDPDHDVYRIELDTVSAALAAGGAPPFGRSDAIAQATVLEALHRSSELGAPVDLTRS